MGKFVQDCALYRMVSRKTYDNILALMNEGDAAAWKEQMLDKAIANATAKDTELDLGTYRNFEKSLTDTFAPYNVPDDALEKMKGLRETGDLINNHMAKFKMLVPDSGLRTCRAD